MASTILNHLIVVEAKKKKREKVKPAATACDFNQKLVRLHFIVHAAQSLFVYSRAMLHKVPLKGNKYS